MFQQRSVISVMGAWGGNDETVLQRARKSKKNEVVACIKGIKNQGSGVGRPGKKYKSAAGRERPSKGEESWQAAGYEL
jgi:hypothetical protein